MSRPAVMICAVVLLTALSGCSRAPTPTCDAPDMEGRAEPVVTLTTNYGCLHGEIYLSKVPVTAGNFLALARDGTYNDTTFHRAIKDFMIQGGDYTMGNGRGGAAHPEYDPDGDGNIPDEFHPDLRHDGPGVFSMANAGPNTGGSQFFITFESTPWLDNRHAVFGRIVEGFDVLDEINAKAARSDQNGVPPLTDLDLVGAFVTYP